MLVSVGDSGNLNFDALEMGFSFGHIAALRVMRDEAHDGGRPTSCATALKCSDERVIAALRWHSCARAAASPDVTAMALAGALNFIGRALQV